MRAQPKAFRHFSGRSFDLPLKAPLTDSQNILILHASGPFAHTTSSSRWSTISSVSAIHGATPHLIALLPQLLLLSTVDCHQVLAQPSLQHR